MSFENWINEGFQLGAALLATLCICLYAIPVIIRVAREKHLLDHPDNYRKLHTQAVPTLGGIGIFASFIIGFSLTGITDQIIGYGYICSALFLIFFAGLKDDLINLSPYKKFTVQMLAAILVILGSGTYFTGLGGVFGIYEIGYLPSFLLTLFTIILVINAYNFIDGINGLAGGIGFIATIFFGFGFYEAGADALAVMSFVLAASLLGFLRYNFGNARIFMGDTGSMIVGFLLSILAVHFVNSGLASPTTTVFSKTVPVLTVSLLIFPLYDALRVILIRLFKGRSPFSPDRDHIHHVYIKNGLSHTETSISLYISSLIVIATCLLLADLSANMQLAGVLVMTLLIFPTAGLKRAILSRIGIDLAAPFSKSQPEFDLEQEILVNGNGSKNGYKLNDEQEISEQEEVLF